MWFVLSLSQSFSKNILAESPALPATRAPGGGVTWKHRLGKNDLISQDLILPMFIRHLLVISSIYIYSQNIYLLYIHVHIQNVTKDWRYCNAVIALTLENSAGVEKANIHDKSFIGVNWSMGLVCKVKVIEAQIWNHQYHFDIWGYPVFNFQWKNMISLYKLIFQDVMFHFQFFFFFF